MAELSDTLYLQARIERLERFVRVAAGATGVLLLSLLVVAASKNQSSPSHVVTAQSFELRDDAGRLRAQLSLKVPPDGRIPLAMLSLYDDAGNTSVLLASASAEASKGPVVSLFRGGQMVQMNIDDQRPLILMNGNAGSLALDASEPSLQITDRDGFEAHLGTAALNTPTTGVKTTTSAASLVLFDKDKRVTWSTPR